MATRLFVGNLPETTDENDLRTAFSNYGEVTNLDLKYKIGADDSKKFAFVTISGTNYNIESCIKHFSNEDFNGNRLYVTRARESFLERLQRERQEAQQKVAAKADLHSHSKKTPVIKLGDKLNPRKRQWDHDKVPNDKLFDQNKNNTLNSDNVNENGDQADGKRTGNVLDMYKRKQDSEMKRMEAMKKKRQEFKEKQKIVKTGLTGVDKVPNKKIIFSDNEEDTPKPVNGLKSKPSKSNKKNTLFDDEDNEDTDDEVNFEIKKQFEGKKGQKVLDLQSRYKSDKRFVLDERFIEDDGDYGKDQVDGEDDQIEVNQKDEKSKQLDILQDVLGVAIKRKIPDEDQDGKKVKPKLGMFRFDPAQPEHAKFMAPIEDPKELTTKKSKKKKDKRTEEPVVEEQKVEPPRPEVSKDQFYKVSETLKEAIAQPTSFSLRSLFGNANENVAEEESTEKEASYIPIAAPKKPKVKNPLEPGEKNPFVYDSSDSETEEVETKTEPTPAVAESKAVWKESFFFTSSDQRLEEGIAFFNNTSDIEGQKERRQLKSLMKKRIYNKDRKDQMQMFKKKIGGRKKTMKKSFRRKT